MTRTTKTTPKSTALARRTAPTSAPVPPLTPAPDGWQSHTPFGLLRFDESAAGRLVRLADVLRWLESAMELPRAVALERLCNAMPPNALDWCYQLQATGYAARVDRACLFGFVTAERRLAIEKEREQKERQGVLKRSSGITTWNATAPTWRRVAVKFLTAIPDAAEPGVPALSKRIRALWMSGRLRSKSTCDVLDDPKATPLVTLAIRLDKAGELWGYGLLAPTIPANAKFSTWAQVVRHRKGRKGLPWDDDQRQLLEQEKSRRGTGAVAAIAAELGVSAESINLALRRTGKRQSKSATTSVVHKLK